MCFIAEEVRELMAKLGVRQLDELIGRTDLLKVRDDIQDDERTKKLDLSAIIETIKNRNYKFIIYMDDLSFEEFEIEYKYLKAVIEGGMEVRPDNVLIYATSNRRHLIRETWSDRSDMSNDELHRSDTMQEKLSLVARFGVSINFSKPSKKDFDAIILGLAKAHPELTLSEEELLMQANAWSIRNGGYSGRVAEQFIIHLQSLVK